MYRSLPRAFRAPAALLYLLAASAVLLLSCASKPQPAFAQPDGTTVARAPRCYNDRMEIRFYRDTNGVVAWTDTTLLHAVNPCPAAPQFPHQYRADVTSR